jgi:hypothetical protein
MHGYAPDVSLPLCLRRSYSLASHVLLNSWPRYQAVSGLAYQKCKSGMAGRRRGSVAARRSIIRRYVHLGAQAKSENAGAGVGPAATPTLAAP